VVSRRDSLNANGKRKRGGYPQKTARSRIKYLWDQDGTQNPPPGYSYGTEWTAAQIDAQQCTHEVDHTHGTHVAGIAAGNGDNWNSDVPPGTYRGLATKSDIVFASLESTPTQTNVAEGLEWIAEKASQDLEKPWVINASVGTYQGPRNGTSAFEEFVTGLLNVPYYDSGGQILVVAAGNESYSPNQSINPHRNRAHSSWTGPRSVTFTTGATATPDEWMGFEIWYPEGSYYQVLLQSPNGTYFGPFGPNEGTGAPGYGWIADDGFVFVHNDHWAQSGDWSDPYPTADGKQAIIILSDFDDQGYYADLAPGVWTLTIDSSWGTWDAYIYGNATADYGAFSESDHTDSRELREPANAFDTITVGAYCTKTGWTGFSGLPNTLFHHTGVNFVIGEEAYFSSHGPTRDGRTKPEVLAPGAAIVSSFDDDHFYDVPVSLRQHIVLGRDHWAEWGTSMAAPHVAGLAALILGADPQLTRDEVLDCIINTADAWNRINARDAFDCAGDFVGVEDLPASGEANAIRVFPNPFNPRTEVRYEISTPGDVSLRVVDVRGRLICDLEASWRAAGIHSAEWNGRDHNGKEVGSGTYYAVLEHGGLKTIAPLTLLK